MAGGQLPPVVSKVGADVSAFTGGMSKAIASTAGFHKALVGAGSALVVFAGASGLKGALDAAVHYETQVAELAKLLGKDLAGPAAESVRNLAANLASSEDSLFGAAAAAARLGVRGTANVAKFTETMGKVGLVTDLSADQASTAMARIAKVTQTPIKDVDRLASAMNEASNNMAVSFSEVLESSLRAAPGLATLGAKAPDIVALSASVAELSANASRSGTRLNRLASMLQNVNQEPALAQALGVTVHQFRQMRQEHPAEVIIQLAEVMKKGGDRARQLGAALDQSSLKVLRALAQNADQARGRIAEMSKAFEDNTSLQEEYAQFADTAAARTTVLKNRMQNLKVEIGQELLPAFVSTLEKLNYLIGALTRLGHAAGGGKALTGMEAVRAALKNMVRDTPLVSSQVEGVGKSIEKAANRFKDSGNRAAFLAQSVQLLRNTVVRTPADLEKLDQALGTLYTSLKQTEGAASSAGDTGVGPSEDDINRTKQENALTEARIRYRRQEMGLTSWQLDREKEKLQQLIAQKATYEEIANQADRVAKLEAERAKGIQPSEKFMKGLQARYDRRRHGVTPQGQLPSMQPAVIEPVPPGTEKNITDIADVLSDPSKFGKVTDALKHGLIPAMDELAGRLHLGTGLLASFADSVLTALGSFLGGKSGGLGILGTALSGFAGGFAKGGKIGAGQWGIVGEAGPEIVRGPASAQPASKGGGGGPVQVQVHFDIRALDAEGVDRVIRTKGARAIGDVVGRLASESEHFSRKVYSGM